MAKKMTKRSCDSHEKSTKKETQYKRALEEILEILAKTGIREKTHETEVCLNE